MSIERQRPSANREELARRKRFQLYGTSDDMSYMLDGRNTLLLTGEPYNLLVFRSYRPVDGDIVMRGSIVVRPSLGDRIGHKATISLNDRDVIEVIHGPGFSSLLGEFQNLARDIPGVKRVRLGTDFIGSEFSYDEYVNGSGRITTEDIIASRRGVCFDFSIVLSMLLNADRAFSPDKNKLNRARVF